MAKSLADPLAHPRTNVGLLTVEAQPRRHVKVDLVVTAVQKRRRPLALDLVIKDLKFEAPASYRIRVQGHLDDSWTDRLGGMVITRAFTQDSQPMTILTGLLLDQAALSGVMNALYGLHLSVISVELIDDMRT